MRWTVLFAILTTTAVTARADSGRSIASKVMRAAKWRPGQPYSAKVAGRVFETGGGLPYVVGYHRDGQGFTVWQVTPDREGKPTLQAKGTTIRKPVQTVREAITLLHEQQAADRQAEQAIAWRKAQAYQSGLMRRYFAATPPDEASLLAMRSEFQALAERREALPRGVGGGVTLKEGTVVYVNDGSGERMVRLKVPLTAPLSKGSPPGGQTSYLQVGRAVVRVPYLIL